MKRKPSHTPPGHKKQRHPPSRKKAAKKKITPIPKSGIAKHLFALFFFLFAWLLYGNTIVEHTASDGWLIPGNFSHQPIAGFTFKIEHYFLGDQTIFSHIFNVSLYGVLLILLFFTLKRLLKNYNILFPFLITMLFAAHPVHTEVVANLNYRGEMLAFFFGIAGLWLFIRYAEKRERRFLYFAGLTFLTGYLCSSSILPFLLLYPLTLYFITGALSRKSLLLLVSTLLSIFVLHFLLRFVFFPAPQPPGFIENPLFFQKNLWIRIGTGWTTLLFYLRIMIYPIPLLYYYGYDMIQVTNMSNWRVPFSSFLYFVLFIIAIWKIRNKKFLSFAIFWYLIAIVFYSNIIFPVQGIVGERYVFNASLGFCMAVITLIFSIFRTDPKSLTIEMDVRLKILASVILVLVPYATLTLTRNHDWRNLSDLYHDDIQYLDKSVKANVDMGSFYLSGNDTVKAIRYFEKAVALYPDPQRCEQLHDLLLLRGENQRATYYHRLGIGSKQPLH